MFIPSGTISRSVAKAAFAVVMCGASASAQATQRAGEVSLDSLLNTRISVAAKYLQTSAEAAASITIISAEDIRQQGYTNLQEVLESVPGMYVSNDRNYPYLGTRGFGRPSDFNNRILVLVDGHSLNEPIWGGAPVGSDLPINLDAVERVEVVRGPGSALYGSSAMFAVINVVTRDGTRTNGSVADVRVGTGLNRQGAVTVGYPIGANSSFAISALVRRANGTAQSYPEFRSSDNPNGTAFNADWENASSLLGTLRTGSVVTRVGFRSRIKGVPTASYGTLFGDLRSDTRDETVWAEVSARASAGPSVHTSLRLYADRGLYVGHFPYDSGPVYADRAIDAVGGADGLLVWDTNSRNRFTVGTELRRAFRAEYKIRDGEDYFSGDNVSFNMVSFLVQDELQIRPKVKLVGGMRFDRKLTRWQAFTPRFAIVATPATRTTVKLLYGEAYRGPSVAESDLNSSYYRPNGTLRAERIATTELAIEQRVRASILLSASLYDYNMHNLIEQTTSDTINGFQFRNSESTRGRGLELALNLQPAESPLAIRWWYAVQRTHDVSARTQLTNSPQQTVNAATLLRGPAGTHAAWTVRYESGRRTLNGTSTEAFARTDLNVGYAPSARAWNWLRGSELSVRVSNLFDTRYAVPGGLEHFQQSIQQDRRMMSVRVRREF